MSNYEYDLDYIGPAEMKLLKNRATCKCTRLQCPNCKRSEDNLVTEYKEREKLWLGMIHFYEQVFRDYGFEILSTEFLISSGIVDSLVEKRITTYEEAKKNARMNIGGL